LALSPFLEMAWQILLVSSFIPSRVESYAKSQWLKEDLYSYDLHFPVAGPMAMRPGRLIRAMSWKYPHS
jgi:hypothetical protein